MTRISTDWFVDGKYGVMLHFLGSTASSDEEWNARVNAFDVHALARQLHEMRAGHLLFTVSQCGGRFCMPIETYDRLLRQSGYPQRLCSERDLVADLYDALEPYGISLLLYAAAEGPHTPELMHLFPWYKGPAEPDRPRGPEGDFDKNWLGMLRELSLRYGTRVKGWWIDGYYPDYEIYSRPDHEYGFRLAEALRAGNPESILAYNCGISIGKVSNAQDYTAGEMSYLDYACSSRYVNGLQWHALGHLGPQWCSRTCAHSNAALVRYVTDCTAHEGVLTFDVAYNVDGTVCPEHYEQLCVLKRFFYDETEWDEADIPENKDYLEGTATLPPSHPIPDGWINIALHAKATCSSYYHLDDKEDYPPHYAFDGDLNTAWAPSGAQGRDFWLQADLGKPYPIEAVRLLSTRMWYRNNFEIVASLHEDASDASVLIRQGNFPMPAERDWSVVLTSPVQARYIRLRSTGTSVPFVPELEVYIRN